MNAEARKLRRQQLIEAREAGARMGPCLGCGTFTLSLQAGRVAGFAVYCLTCADQPREDATLEERR